MAEKVVPLFGPAVVGELTRGLEEGGALPAARRLLALCRIDPDAGLAALRRLDPAAADWVAGQQKPAAGATPADPAAPAD